MPAPEPEDVFVRLASLPHCLFLDSALRHPALGRYSFVAADPFDFLELPADGSDALGVLAARMEPFAAAAVRDLPPFQGGAAGLLGYDLARSLERVSPAAMDEFGVPALAMGLYDVVVAFDHVVGRAWIISQGLPETDPSRRRRRAAERVAQMRGRLAGGEGGCRLDAVETRPLASPGHDLAADQLARQYVLADVPGVTSNFSQQAYLKAVQRTIDYIYAGDVFQVNLSQRLLMPARGNAVSLYRRLRNRNPAPMAGYFDLGAFQILSASPERFLRLAEGSVETRPIKGTRPRSGDSRRDALAAAELAASEKDRAENVMIVDLMRNDLARVCTPPSVRVSQLCGVEVYPYVLHLVSAVCGQLRPRARPSICCGRRFPGARSPGHPRFAPWKSSRN